MAVLEEVYMTLVMSDSYLPGAAVLAHSLRDAGTAKKLACIITIDTLSADTVSELRELYDYVIPVPRIINPHPGNLFLMDRGDLLFTFTKINLWRQVQFRKIVYIDADVVALRAPDELFDIRDNFAAAPDAGWPDAFNTGLMVITPDMGEYWALQTLASSGDSFDGADQGLLNQYYEHRPWHRLSFTYNCTPNAEYQWEPAYKYHKSNIKMVHFIGKDKPWTKGRYYKTGKGIYNELHSRWWAVYDRHLKKPVQEYVPGRSFAPPASTVRQYVAGEATDVYGGVPPEEHVPPPAATEVAPLMAPEPKEDVPTAKIRPPFTESGERQQNLEKGYEQPQPTTQVRRFTAPHAEWDATRSAPPAESGPEAANLPTQEYTFSESRQLFHAPVAYPEPPKDLHYQIPEEKPKPQEPPKPIFPWEREEYHRPKPSRIFAEDASPPPALPASLEAASVASPEEEDIKSITAALAAAQVADELVFQPFQPQPNAWDNVHSIERYVRAVMDAQMRRNSKQQPQPEEPLSPSGRRGSLILTDFPTADDRPSLPVTPAPIRRPTFWGDERDEAGELPPAEGVPEQADWNPTEKLEQLRRNSLVEYEHLKAHGAQREMSLRDMPEHSAMPVASEQSDEGKQDEAPPSEKHSSYFPTIGDGTAPPPGTATKIPGREDYSSEQPQRNVAPAKKGQEEQDPDISPTAIPSAPVSSTTATAEFSGAATSAGGPIFDEPEFGVDEPAPIQRSAGSFSAESALEAENFSPTER